MEELMVEMTFEGSCFQDSLGESSQTRIKSKSRDRSCKKLCMDLDLSPLSTSYTISKTFINELSKLFQRAKCT